VMLDPGLQLQLTADNEHYAFGEGPPPAAELWLQTATARRSRARRRT